MMSGNDWHDGIDANESVQEFDVLTELRVHVARYHKSQNNFAAHLGVMPSFISAVMTGRKPPTKQILDDAGIERIVLYKFKDKS